MKIKILLLTVFFISTGSFAQGLTQDAEGESTLLFRGSNISIDIAKTNLTLGFNNVDKVIGETSHHILGADISGKNEEGISNLFSKGKLVPTAKGSLYAGWSRSNGVLPNIESSRLEVTKKKIKADTDFDESFYQNMPSFIKFHTNDNIKSFRDDLLKSLIDKESISNFKKKLEKKENDSDELQKAKDNISKELKKIEDKRDEKMELLNKEWDKFQEMSENTKYWQVMVFGFGAITASEFKRFTAFDDTDFNKSFSNEYFRGGSAGIGLNAQWGNILLGLAYNYSATNNFNLLTKKEYTIKNAQTNGNQSITEEKKITAYSGTYGEVEINEFNADVVVNFSLDNQSSNHVLVNPYFRGKFFSREKTLLPNTMNIGCGFYFFKNNGKFMGGFYTELPDINNQLEKAKPIAEQNLRDPLKRLSFGIIGKFSINSILNLF